MTAALVILALVALLVGVPLLTLLHELGHAVAAALLVGGRVTVLQGPEPRRLALSAWRLDLRLHGPCLPHAAWIGWARWERRASIRRHALALAAGPAASALAAAACFAAAVGIASPFRWILFGLGVDAACQLASSALPVRYPRFAGSYAAQASDGLRIRWLLTGAVPHRDLAPLAPNAPDRAEAA